MIERLVHALQLLALPAERQLARGPDFAAQAGELALDFDDALRLVRDCPQMELTDAQHAALGAVDALLSRMSDEVQPAPWTEQAVRGAPEWRALRHAAADALAALGQPPLPPQEPGAA